MLIINTRLYQICCFLEGGFLGLLMKLLRGGEIRVYTVKEITEAGFGLEKETAACVKLIAVFNKDIKSYYDEYSGQLFPFPLRQNEL